MAEVENRLLVSEQAAYLREVIDADDAFLERHGLTDPESLRNQMEAAYRRGELRATQVPSGADRGAGVGQPLTGAVGYVLTRGTDEQRRTLAELQLNSNRPPPQAETEELLETLPTPERRLEYLRGLRDRMDRYEDAACRTPDRDTLLGGTYLDLVRLVLHQTAINRAAVKERGGTAPSARDTGTDRQNRIETPLPDEEDDGTRVIYRAVSDYYPRGIEQGKRYSLWPGDVLVKAGVVRPVPVEPPSAIKPAPPTETAVSPPEPEEPGYIAYKYAEDFREAFRQHAARIRARRSAPFKAWRDAAGLEETAERTVKRSLGYRKSDGLEGFVRALFAAVGEKPPDDGQTTSK